MYLASILRAKCLQRFSLFFWGKQWLIVLCLAFTLNAFAQEKRFQKVLGSPLLGPVNCLAIDPQNTVWAGTEQGLLKIQGERKELLTPNNSSLRDGHINCLAIDQKGNKWMGSYQYGLMKLSPQGQFEHFPFEGGFLHLVSDLAIDPKGQIWVSTMQEGIFRLKGERLVPAYRDGDARFPSNTVYALGFLPDGRLWAGTDRGLAIMDGRKFDVHKEIVGVKRLIPFGGGLIACGLTGEGPQLWEYRKKWKGAPELCQPLPTLKGIIRGQRYLWLNTDEGLLRFDGTACRRFDERDGLKAETVASAAIDTAGNVWVGLATGEVLALLPPKPEPTPPPPAPLQAGNIRAGENAVLQNVRFQRGTSQLLDSLQGFQELTELVKYWKAHPAQHLHITGHTSNQGSAVANWNLSKARARAVRNWLEALGIPAQRLHASWEGERKPLVPNDSEENRQKNRRVEVVFRGGER